MKHYLTTVFVITLLALSSPSFATDYYVCDSGGDDGNFGTTVDKPFKTFSKASEIIRLKMKGGDTLSFCRGGKFEVTEYKPFDLYKVSADIPGEIKDYYPPGSSSEAPLPIIYNTSGGALYFGNRNFDKPNGGIIVRNLHLLGNGDGVGSSSIMALLMLFLIT